MFAGAIGRDGDLASSLQTDGRDELIGQELTGKVAIVTGGSSGIGRAAAELFVDEGACVVIADVDVEHGEELAEVLGAAAAFKRTDVADGVQVQELVDFAVARFGGLHVMFNNAGISSSFRRLLENDLRDFDRVMAVNLLGVMVGTRCAARHMAGQGGGSIINTTSMGALTGGALPIVYRTSKAAVIQFSRGAATDLAEYGIRVNCIAPGHISTGITNYDLGPVIRRSQPLQRQGTPADVANAVLFLAGERSAQVTGIVVPVDGGTAAGPSIQQTMLLAEGSQGGGDAS
jgi:NAD(P)-dependent dehydrogenase (short-subunit alcohol dehydrogenase family)